MADKPLSPGRSEWTGLLLVLCIVRRVHAHVALRLGNLQVVTTFSDGLAHCEHNWLRKNDRDMASLAWGLSAGATGGDGHAGGPASAGPS